MERHHINKQYIAEKSHLVRWIIKLRFFLLRHFKNKKIQTLIWGLISYEMILYMAFGAGTAIIDFATFAGLQMAGMYPLVANIISTICAIIFAYITNRIWVFRSKVKGVKNVLLEFLAFSEVRVFTLVMTEFILLIDHYTLRMPKTAKFIGLVLTVILNYVFSKLFIFSDKKNKKNKRRKQNNESEKA